MPFLHVRPSEIRAPKIEVLPDGRKRLTRLYKLAQLGVMPPELDLAWGTLDVGEAPAGWIGLRLTNKQFSDVTRLSSEATGQDPVGVCELVYEQIDASAETPVGGRITTKLDDGRTALVDNFIQFSTGIYVPLIVGTATAAGAGAAFLQTEKSEDDGTVRRIVRTFVSGGQLSERTFRVGTILAKTLVYAKIEPPTPVGYVAVDQREVQNPAGYPIYTYTFYALNDAGYSVQRYIEQTMPGRAKAYYVTYAGYRFIELFRSPPVSVKILATITLSYQTDNTITAPSDLWSPKEWAVLRAQWLGWGRAPHSQVEALSGYLAEGSAVELVASGVAPSDLSILGNPVFGATQAKLEVTGGPANPSGGTFTFDVQIDETPAFIAASGTKYYRKTTVVGTFPTQAALPV